MPIANPIPSPKIGLVFTPAVEAFAVLVDPPGVVVLLGTEGEEDGADCPGAGSDDEDDTANVLDGGLGAILGGEMYPRSGNVLATAAASGVYATGNSWPQKFCTSLLYVFP